MLLSKDRLVHPLDDSTGMRLRQVGVPLGHMEGFVPQNFGNLR